MKLIILLFTFLLSTPLAIKSQSVYSQKPDDPGAFYFTADSFNIKADGKYDVSEALQLAINKLKKEKHLLALTVNLSRSI